MSKQSLKVSDSVPRIVATQMRLIQQGRAVYLEATEGTFSYYHPQRLFTGFSWDAQTASLLLVRHAIRTILILGLGGGTVARQCRALLPNADIVGVEINPDVLEVAYKYFELASVGVTDTNMPGQTYLRKTRRKFDAIIDDMWLPLPQSPKPVLVEPRWAELVISRLQPGGVYAVNLYNRRENSYEIPTAIGRLKCRFSILREVRPSQGETTVIAAGLSLRTPREVRTELQRLAKPLVAGLSHVKFLNLDNARKEA